ncbi:MAG TPA: hypothetical protein VHS27_13225 [Gaiellales bacterium]|nr:hypothetical protein [Gaiellales bacterium]
MTTTHPPRASEANPGGISLDDAVRALKAAGYDDWAVWEMIEVVKPDLRGAKRWRWRTEALAASPGVVDLGFELHG